MAKLETCAMAIVICKNKILSISELVFGRKVLSLPKGHLESGEDIIETAIRECFEETNIVISKDDMLSELTPYSYNFTLNKEQLIRKTVYPFLFRVDNFGSPKAKEETMVSVDWLDIEDFLNRCTYDSVKNLVNEALLKM
jgi:8-oxo-dGTP pyrophosphatase MutT (NUDIX family)